MDKCSTKFHVIDVNQEMIFDFKSSLAPFYKKTVTSTDKIKWTISKYRRFEYSNEGNIPQISASINHNGPLTIFDIAKKENIQGDPFSPKLLYSSNLPLNGKKYEDVMTLARKYVPPSDMSFYNDLSSQDNVLEPEESDYKIL